MIPLGTYRVIESSDATVTGATYHMVRVAWDWGQVATHYAAWYGGIVALLLFAYLADRFHLGS